MAVIKVTGFGGMIPKLGETLLPETNAVDAENCRLSSGELIPFDAPQIQTPRGDQALSIHRMLHQGKVFWLAWEKDVDAVKGPFPQDDLYRLYYTGDGPPKVTTFELASVGSTQDKPQAARILGVPLPTTAPVVGHSGGAGVAESRFYCYTFISDWFEESGPSPLSGLATGKADGTWSISGMQDAPANSGSCTASHVAGVTTVTSVANHWLRRGDEIRLGSTDYSVQNVLDQTQFTVNGDASAEVTWSRRFPMGAMTKRLYRTSGSAGTFQLVAEGITGSSYSDTLSSSQILGDDMVSSGWEPPPGELNGLISTPWGSLAGFIKNTLYISEPYQPHAFVASYSLTTASDIVGIASYGSSIVIATTGRAYVANGSGPDSLTLTQVGEALPCVSKRSVIAYGNAVLYASANGLVRVGDAGLDVMTQSFYTREKWNLLKPESIRVAAALGRVYAAYQLNNTMNELLIFDFTGPPQLTTSVVNPTALFSDMLDGNLYFSDGESIKMFDPVADVATYPMELAWESRQIALPKPSNFGAARVSYLPRWDYADAAERLGSIAETQASNAALIASGDLEGAIAKRSIGSGRIGGSSIRSPQEDHGANLDAVFVMYGDDQEIFRATVQPNALFRLPGSALYNYIRFRVETHGRVMAIEVATTARELANA